MVDLLNLDPDSLKATQQVQCFYNVKQSFCEMWMGESFHFELYLFWGQHCPSSFVDDSTNALKPFLPHLTRQESL